MTGLDLANYDVTVLYQSKNSGRKSANIVRQIEQRLQDSVLMKQWSKSMNSDDDDDDDDDDDGDAADEHDMMMTAVLMIVMVWS